MMINTDQLVGQKSNRYFFAFFVILLILSGKAYAGENYIAHYVLYWDSLKVGVVERKLTKTNGVYNFSSVVKPKGLAKFFTRGLVEKSRFIKTKSKIRPLEYFYEQKGKKNRVIKHKYSWNNKSLNIIEPVNFKIRKIKDDTIDILSFQHLISSGLAKGSANFIGRVYKKTKDPDVYSLRVSGKDIVTVPAGSYATVKVSRTNASNKTFNLWCAKDLNFLPIKIEHITKKGELARMELVSFSSR